MLHFFINIEMLLINYLNSFITLFLKSLKQMSFALRRTFIWLSKVRMSFHSPGCYWYDFGIWNNMLYLITETVNILIIKMYVLWSVFLEEWKWYLPFVGWMYCYLKMTFYPALFVIGAYSLLSVAYSGSWHARLKCFFLLDDFTLLASLSTMIGYS